MPNILMVPNVVSYFTFGVMFINNQNRNLALKRIKPIRAVWYFATNNQSDTHGGGKIRAGIQSALYNLET